MACGYSTRPLAPQRHAVWCAAMDPRPPRARGTLLAGVLLAGISTLAADCNRQPRAPFLCCVQECNGGLITSHKESPGKDDAGWACDKGLPIDFNGTCTAEEGVDCNQQGTSGTDPGSGTHSGSGTAQSSSNGPSSN